MCLALHFMFDCISGKVLVFLAMSTSPSHEVLLFCSTVLSLLKDA